MAFAKQVLFDITLHGTRRSSSIARFTNLLKLPRCFKARLLVEEYGDALFYELASPESGLLNG
jgi:hypothetical protein